MLDGRDVAHVPPHKRNVNTVFQSYALFPHLDVAGNVAFGLKYQKLGKDEQAQAGRARRSSSCKLASFARRKPGQLSGGQQQRVALARALVLRPRVLLLDEPLGALDARLRKDLQVELKALQAELGITFVFVTHDQEEALTMSDRIAVMNEGRVEQAGAPREVYEEPSTVFVADFLGVSNLLAADAVGPDGDACSRARRRPHVPRQSGSGRGARRGEGDDPPRARRDRAARRRRRQPAARRGRAVGVPRRLPRVHVRVLGGDLVKATVANDGKQLGVALEPGEAVSLHLPPDGLRVLSGARDRVDAGAEPDLEPEPA